MKTAGEARDNDSDGVEELPGLEESSGSSEMDTTYESVSRSRDSSLLDSVDDEVRCTTPIVSKTLTSDLLATAAALHFGEGSERRSYYTRSNTLMETRSSFSSPGKTNFTLRQKLSRLSKTQRKELLVRNNHPSQAVTKEEVVPTLEPVDEESQTPEQDSPARDSYTRLKRQQYYMSRTSSPRYHSNRIILHVYDLIAKDTLMQLPWGMVCEIGQCFNHMNTALHELGTGVYHVGIEINGIEYAFGATNIPGRTGVFSCIPKCSPGYQYRTSIDFGDREVVRRSWAPVGGGDPNDPSTVYQHTEEYMDGRQIIKEMAREYLGTDYDILRKNCCTFSHQACLRLGVREDEIPSWFRNLAESGAMTQDAVSATVEPLQQVFSTCDSGFDHYPVDEGYGFEIIIKRNETNTKDVVFVMNATSSPAERSRLEQYGLRRTLTWTY